MSRPNPARIQSLASQNAAIFPSGIAAASFLGFTTQTARQVEIAANAPSLPRKLIGSDTIVHTRRPQAWSNLSSSEAALLDLFRQGGRTSELSPEQTVSRTLRLLSEEGRLDRFWKVSGSEPPRVRAILGAIGEQLAFPPARLQRLRNSLNPLSRFDFGAFAALTYANRWQAKKPRRP